MRPMPSQPPRKVRRPATIGAGPAGVSHQAQAVSIAKRTSRRGGGRLARLLNDLVRPSQHGLRDRETERLGGLEVEHEVELGGLLDGQVTRRGALENALDV